MKNKHILIIFIFGLVCVFAGIGFKFARWQGGDELLAGGMIIQAVCMVLLVFKIMKKDSNDSGFLDS